jgi:uroporphyrinogen decarboxylase
LVTELVGRVTDLTVSGPLHFLINIIFVFHRPADTTNRIHTFLMELHMARPLEDVLRGTEPERRPVWLMRQAGRYLPEYRKVREQAGSFLSLCYNPKLAAEVTLQPLSRFDLDAAIVFADILVVPHAMGCGVEFKENEGPVLQPVRNWENVKSLGSGVGSKEFGLVCETLALTRSALSAEKTLIGFCGGPWTVASYMVEGKGSGREFALEVARAAPAWFVGLIDALVEASVGYLVGQVRAGADVLQIFDSWAGDLQASERARWVLGPLERVVKGVRDVFPEVPIIAFARGFGLEHVNVATSVACNAVGVEQDCDIGALLRLLPKNVGLQGNLSPGVLVDGGDRLRGDVEAICRAVPKNRHIFNLGHGILPHTPIENVGRLVDLVRQVDGVS